ncbi:hypothetical protein MA16_Dca028159 [Dendrobium catenatum]|uniref:Uncharacterized protein n=1 Tax=Dendrobium catenatum TaxID=906689 RepID=A0A2I0VED7_9ASPA|nr:hypothetical protein MA16_Dca028159 [Dendrobium catenatum]
MPPFPDTDRISRILAPYASLCAHGTITDVLIAPEQNSSDPEQNRYQISDLSSFQIFQTLTESLRIQAPYNSLFIAYTDSISIQKKYGQIIN